MGKGRYLTTVAALLVCASAFSVLSAGCIDLVGDYYTPLTDPALATTGSSSSSTSSSSSSSSSGTMPSCIPSMNSMPVAKTCGVFVSSVTGDDTNGMGT